MSSGKDLKIKEKNYKVFLSKMIIVSLLILAQIAFIILINMSLNDNSIYIELFVRFLAVLLVINIINKHENPAYKLAWVVPILIFPVAGVPLYFLLHGNRSSKRFMKNINDIEAASTRRYLRQNQDIIKELEEKDPSICIQSRYISETAAFPVYRNTKTKYFPIGEKYMDELLEKLSSAKRFIFMEFYIIKPGVFWDSVLEILTEKARAGVDVRLIYDDVGCMTTLPSGFSRSLEKRKIKCAMFNPFIPVVSTRLNHRDHRKIVVIDGHTAFTGGINIADEYINVKHPFGRWKDSGTLLVGDAAWSFTVLFLQMWEHLRKDEEDFSAYRPFPEDIPLLFNDGYVQPYGDSPTDREIVGESIYMNIITRAKRYVYITTPYLIIDNEMLMALSLAAKSGVDVRIITPDIPDKKIVFLVTKSYYRPLVEAGVKIYQYKPGFMHSKTVVADDEVATSGTINLDFRSLYLHFECGVWMYNSGAVLDIRDDYLKTLEECRPITRAEFRSDRLPARLMQSILKLFAPLL